MWNIECPWFKCRKVIYFERKAHKISFFSSIWSWRHTFFFIKLIKHDTSYTKYIITKNSFKNFFLNLLKWIFCKLEIIEKLPIRVILLKYCTFSSRTTWPKGLNYHLSIRHSTLTSCQKGSYLHISCPIIEKITRGPWATSLNWENSSNH